MVALSRYRSCALIQLAGSYWPLHCSCQSCKEIPHQNLLGSHPLSSSDPHHFQLFGAFLFLFLRIIIYYTLHLRRLRSLRLVTVGNVPFSPPLHKHAFICWKALSPIIPLPLKTVRCHATIPPKDIHCFDPDLAEWFFASRLFPISRILSS